MSLSLLSFPFLSFISIIIMMSFCKKSVHSFLGITSYMNIEHHGNTEKQQPSCGSGLITATVSSDAHETPNVLESASVKSSPTSSPPPPMSKKDPGGIGFIDDIGGGVNGLMSCTESLGFESSDERRIDDDIDLCSRESTIRVRNKYCERREVKKFPPPLSSLNHNGQPNFFLRPVRKDGRLELTEVRIDRPEILRASRQNGRLRLHFIRDYEDFDVNEKEQEDQEQQLEEDEKEEVEVEVEDVEVGEEANEEEKDKDRLGEWEFPVTGAEGFRRCNEVVARHPDYHQHHHHTITTHHDLHVWNRHCVTTS